MMDKEMIKKQALIPLVVAIAILVLKTILSTFLSKYIGFAGNTILEFISLYLIILVVSLATRKIAGLGW